MDKLTARTTVQIGFLVLMWGISWSIYKSALLYTPPILFAGMRALLGGTLLSVFLLPRRNNIKWRANWVKYSISALLNVVFFLGIQTSGLVHLPGGLFSVLVYFQPVLIGLFAWMWIGERMNFRKIAGLLVGFLGILAVGADGFTGKLSIFGITLAVLTAISWALGVIYVKKESEKVDSMWMVAIQFIIGGIVLSIVGVSLESGSDIVWNGTFLFSLVYGITIGIPITFVIYYKLINEGEASKVASFTFLVPLIAVLTGTVFLDEPFTYSLFYGMVLIVASIFLVNVKKRAKMKGKFDANQ